jgi:general secretion pathway protein L
VALGSEVTLRLVEMPFADAKKVSQALPFELAGQLMTDLDDQIVDQSLARPMPTRSSASAGGLGGEGEPSSLWLAACAPRPLVQERLAALAALGLDPRLCAATALAGAALFMQTARRPAKGKAKAETPELPAEAETELPVWVVDLGHRTTHVCAVAPHPSRSGLVLVTFARTMARGGEQLTQALARALQVDFARAEDLKHMHGVAEDAEPQVSTVLREALRPLLRDLRQTLAAYVGRYGEPPRCIHLTGGTAQLSGLPDIISHELGIEVKPLLPPNGAPWLQSAQRDARAAMSLGASDDAIMRTHVIAGPMLVRRWPTCATAVGLALAGATPAPQLNFRKGDLGYRNDYAFVREKAPYLAAFAAALLCCVVVWAWASLKVLEKESERLRLQLISETTTLFGEPRTNGRAVSAELASVLTGDKGNGQSIPTISALDLVEEISRAAPKTNAAGPARLDVVDLSIRPKKAEIKATAGSAQYVDDLAAALGKIPCFKSVQKGKVLTVRNMGPDNKPFDVKQFSLEITTTCP